MWVLGIIWCQPAVGPDQGTYRYAAVIVLRQHQTTISKPSHIIVCEWLSQFRAPTLGSDGRQTAKPNPTRAKMSTATDAPVQGPRRRMVARLFGGTRRGPLVGGDPRCRRWVSASPPGPGRAVAAGSGCRCAPHVEQFGLLQP